MSQVFGENNGKGFEKDPTMEIFLKALESAVLKSPVRDKDKVYLSDLWFITSLPEDLMIEVIRDYNDRFNFPKDINVLYDDKRKKVLWKRKKEDKVETETKVEELDKLDEVEKNK